MINLSVKSLAAYAYPEDGSKSPFSTWLHRSKFILRGLLYYPALRTLTQSIEPNTLMMLLQKHRQFIEKPMRPYLTCHYSAKQRAELIVQHYQFLEHESMPRIVNSIYRQDHGLTLFSFEVDEQTYSMTLCYDSSYRREGEMALVLRSPDSHAFYAVAFSLATTKGIKQLRIGGLQGPASNVENNEKIKRLTKTLNGLRPKDLMLRILVIMANLWQIEQVLAVKNHAHIYRSKRYRKDKVKADYDAHWQTFSGTEFDRDFYLLPQFEHRKTPEEISRPKRAMYRRRYQWIDDVTEQIRIVLMINTLNPHSTTKHDNRPATPAIQVPAI